MRQSLRRSAFAVLGLLLVAGAMLPTAVAMAATAQNVTNGDEGWFLKNKEPLAGSPVGDPSCDLPTGCNVSGNVTRPSGPHPEGVLVVAANGGDDDAQTFFNFNVDKLPLGALVTGGTVTMPVAQDSDARNFRPEAAKLVACLVTGFIPGGTDGGSYEARPEFDDKTCVDVKQDESAKTLTYTFDLERFGKAWGSGTPMNGVTILKDPKVTAPNPDETWRVVFNQTRRGKDDPKAFPPITSTLQFKVEKVPDFEVPPTGGGGGGTVPSGGSTGGFPPADPGTGSAPPADFGSGATDPSFGSGSVPTDTGSVGSPTTADTAPVGAAPPAAAADPPLTTAPPVGGAVPAAANPSNLGLWLLPFLALAMAGALWWSLSRPVELAGDREGAVSRLMRNRRLAAEASTPSTS